MFANNGGGMGSGIDVTEGEANGNGATETGNE
jgi:hypothetical protein